MRENFFISLFFMSTLIVNAQSFLIPRDHYYYQIKVKADRVIDGDTFVTADSDCIRLLGVNAPELEEEKC